MNAHHFFVGFGTLEALLNSHQPGTPVYLELVTETRGGAISIESCTLVVTDVQDGVCRYWRKKVAQCELINGHPIASRDEHRAAHAMAEECRKTIEKLIREVHRFEIQAAAVSMPRDLSLMDGATDCLKLDTEKRVFVPA